MSIERQNVVKVNKKLKECCKSLKSKINMAESLSCVFIFSFLPAEIFKITPKTVQIKFKNDISSAVFRILVYYHADPNPGPNFSPFGSGSGGWDPPKNN